ncbi:glycosyltransferase family 4 protein [Patescibacteria group bacterium]|nr:glycosyltransferase family 4 protein [Patescibacteria group bacterium]
MKILFITRAYGDDAGGMERLSWELIQAMKQLPNLTVSVIARRSKPKDSLSTSRLKSIVWLVPAMLKALFMAPRVEVIHLGDPLLAKIGWLLKLLYRKPIAVTVHGLDVSYQGPFYRLYLKLFFKHFALYLPISQHAATRLAPWQVTGQITIIHPGVSDRHYDPAIPREQLSILLNRALTNEVIVATVGRLVPRKGHRWFITHVLPKLPANTLYLIAGEGPEKLALAEAANDAGVSNQVFLLGTVTDKQLIHLYNTIDAFIQPNIKIAGDAEGFGLAMLEAALCERPVFAANLEGISDAIKNGVNGTLLTAEDATAWIHELTAFIQNPTTSPTARTHTLATFGWASQAKRYQQHLLALQRT